MARTKYNVDRENLEKRTYDNILFDSVLEMKYYRDVLLPLVESGDVVKYELQKPYELLPEFTHLGTKVKAITYVADFYMLYKDGHEVIIDTKGCPDQTAILKRKLFWHKYPAANYVWMCYSKIDGGWVTYEYVKKKRAERKRARSLKAKEK